MSNKKNLVNLILINLSVLVFFILSPAILLKIYRGLFQTDKLEKLANTSAFESKKKRRKIISEMRNLKSDYIPYIGWNIKPYSGEYINIEKNYNSRNSYKSNLAADTFFFGGSTMWGYGLADIETIPSHFAKISKRNVFNFGVNGYTSRQSLNRLITLLNDKDLNPKNIIFLSGVNDVEVNCKKSTKYIPSNSSKDLIRSRLSNHEMKLAISILLRRILEPFTLIANSQKNKKLNISPYNCSENFEKAEEVAKELISNWKVAYLIAKEKGINLKVVLQPHIFNSKEKVPYLDYVNDFHLKFLKKEFDSTYPLVISGIRKYCNDPKGFCNVFIDGSNWLSLSNDIWTDFCHLNSKGNQILAEKIFENFQK